MITRCNAWLKKNKKYFCNNLLTNQVQKFDDAVYLFPQFTGNPIMSITRREIVLGGLGSVLPEGKQTFNHLLAGHNASAFPNGVDDYIIAVTGKELAAKLAAEPRKHILRMVFAATDEKDVLARIAHQLERLKSLVAKEAAFEKEGILSGKFCETYPSVKLTDKQFSELSITANAPMDTLPGFDRTLLSEVHRTAQQREREMMDRYMRETYAALRRQVCPPTARDVEGKFSTRVAASTPSPHQR